MTSSFLIVDELLGFVRGSFVTSLSRLVSTWLYVGAFPAFLAPQCLETSVIVDAMALLHFLSIELGLSLVGKKVFPFPQDLYFRLFPVNLTFRISRTVVFLTVQAPACSRVLFVCIFCAATFSRRAFSITVFLDMPVSVTFTASNWGRIKLSDGEFNIS